MTEGGGGGGVARTEMQLLLLYYCPWERYVTWRIGCLIWYKHPQVRSSTQLSCSLGRWRKWLQIQTHRIKAFDHWTWKTQLRQHCKKLGTKKRTTTSWVIKTFTSYTWLLCGQAKQAFTIISMNCSGHWVGVNSHIKDWNQLLSWCANL